MEFEAVERKLLSEKRARSGIWIGALLFMLAFSAAAAVSLSPLYVVACGLCLWLLFRAVRGFQACHALIRDYRPGISGLMPLDPAAPLKAYKSPFRVWRAIAWGAFQISLVSLVMLSAALEGVATPGLLLAAIVGAIAATVFASMALDVVRKRFSSMPDIHPEGRRIEQAASPKRLPLP